MILQPAILALLFSSALTCLTTLYSAFFAILIVRKWNLKSGSELQLALERRTYLISTMLAYLFGFQLVSLFLFIFTADRLCGLFVGAMCATGTLHAAGFGFPTLLLKILNFLLAGLWLILNHVDNRACDYPLVKTKNRFLLFMSPLILAEAVAQALFFLGLKPDVITSCCGSLFSATGTGVAAELAALPPGRTEAAFFAVFALTILAAGRFTRRGEGGYLLAAMSALSCAVGVVSLISFISVYIYELPNHHCPFCVLQRAYGYVGYPLYLTLLGGTVCGLGVGVLMPFRGIHSLVESVPRAQKRLALVCALQFLAFAAIAIWRLLSTDFRP